MAKSLVTNVSLSPITLPPPYIGIIPPGVSVVIDQPTAVVIEALYAVPSVARFLTVSETSDASRTTIRVSTTAAAAATEQVIADITGPLDLNGQRAINAGTPIAAADLATKAYVDAHGGSGGTVTAVTAAAPLASTGGTTPEISLTVSGVIAGTYGDPSAADQSTLPSITVTDKGLVTTASADAVQIGGSPARVYVDAGDAATLSAANAFAESLAFGISSKDSVHTATTGPLPANTPDGTFQILTATSNGVLPDIGGHSLMVGQRVLIKDEAAQANNGIYVVTSLGAADPGGSPWVLTRASDANTASELCGSTVPVETGTLAGTVWIFAANSATFVFGTTPVIWTELSVGAATTSTLGTVQLAAGLGGAGTAAIAPTLDVDHATSGTLARVRGGTGLAVAGPAGNVLTSNGLDWASSPIPNVSIARTYFVAVSGSDTTGDGSISQPFATIGAAQTKANADLAPTDYARILVGPGTYVGNVSLTRRRTLIEGAGGRVETQASRISGQVLVNPTSAISKFDDVVYLSGFFVQPAVTSDAALRLVGASLFQFIATDCYFTSNGSAEAISDETTHSGQPRLFLQDCVITTQQNTPARTVYIANAETRIFRSLIGHASSVTAGQSLVFINLAGTLWADSTIFESRTPAGRMINCAGTAPAAPAVKLLVSNSSLANTQNGPGIFLSVAGLTALVTQTTFGLQTGASYALGGVTGTAIAYANLTFLTGSTTTIQSTLTAIGLNETHGTLLLPSLGAGMLVKTTATAPVTVQPIPTGPGLIPVPAGSATFAEGTPVTINELGVLAAANAASTNTAPAVGLYVTVSGSAYIRMGGEQTVAGPLVAGRAYYLANGGGLTDTAPASAGSVIQFLGRALNATTLFVSPATIVVA